MKDVEAVVNTQKESMFKEQSLYVVKEDEFKDLRCEGKKHFDFLGFPTTKNEEWKYTNILPVVSRPFDHHEKFTGEKFNTGFIVQDAIVINIINGYVADVPGLPQGMTVRNLNNAYGDETVSRHLGRYTDHHVDALAALNTANLNEGIYIKIDRKVRIERPVYIIHHTSPSGKNTISHPRCLIVAEEGSQAAVEWLTVSGMQNGSAFINAVTEIVVKENARLDFCILQNDAANVSQVCNTYAYQESNSLFNINTITTGGDLVRNKLHIMLNGQNVETHLFGLYMGSGKQLIDNHSAVYHAKPNCFSNQRYKGILDDNSQGVFNGKILVMQDAQKTNAYQSNKNILLSDGASMNAKPQLEIFADDVKCSHGATTGQLDEEALFYLRSRGIEETRAKALLNVAFAADVIQNIPNESLREYIMGIIQEKLIKD